MFLSFVLTVAVLGMIVAWAERRFNRDKPVCQEIDRGIAKLQARRTSSHAVKR